MLWWFIKTFLSFLTTFTSFNEILREIPRAHYFGIWPLSKHRVVLTFEDQVVYDGVPDAPIHSDAMFELLDMPGTLKWTVYRGHEGEDRENVWREGRTDLRRGCYTHLLVSEDVFQMTSMFDSHRDLEPGDKSEVEHEGEGRIVAPTVPPTTPETLEIDGVTIEDGLDELDLRVARTDLPPLDLPPPFSVQKMRRRNPHLHLDFAHIEDLDDV